MERRNPLGQMIFMSRWLQLPLYLGLIIAQAVYVYKFTVEVYHLVISSPTFTEEQLMLSVLSMVDIVMISNLLIMVIIGGYETFVSRLRLDGHPDEPEWLGHVNSGTLKIKLALALVSISAIHLLKTFIDIQNHVSEEILWQVVIHLTFLVSALVMAWIDRISHTPSTSKQHK